MRSKNWLIVLWTVLILETMLLISLVDRYRLTERLELVIDQDRMPVLSENFLRNIYYKQYISLFSQYLVESGSIIFLGDSMVAIPDWNRLVSDEHGEIVNFGIPGDSIAGVTHRLKKTSALQPRLLVLWVGTNDVLQGRASTEISGDIAELRDGLSQINTAVVIVATSPLSAAVEDYVNRNNRLTEINAQLEKMAASLDAVYVSTSLLRAPDSQHLIEGLSSDGVHLNGEGYRLIADELEQVLDGLFELDE